MNEQEQETTGIRLLKKGKKGLIHMIFSRMGLILVLMALQVFLLVGIVHWFGKYLPHIVGGTLFFTIIMVLYLLNSCLDPSAKITWLILIMLFPVAGSILLLYTQTDIGYRTVGKRSRQLRDEANGSIPQSEEVLQELSATCPEPAMLAHYVGRTGCYPIYRHTDVTYFPLGEAKFEAMLQQLEQAKHFIFMEYFIVDEGVMWGKVLEVLARKASEGVEIRFLYDGTCEFSLLPHDYPKRLKKLGIHCKVFLPATPFVSTHYNFRDHRKILVIDGHTAFTGGVNLADEYINRKKRFGHWKDTAIMLKGPAVKSFTLMFLQMWNIDEKTPDFKTYLGFPVPSYQEKSGYVLPYGDSPFDHDKVGERIYMDILNHAQHYVHIMSPYLILDSEMETALKFAAERGVEVCLILPGIPDKKIPYALAKTHYPSLLASGVKIYEYTPGFVHAKVFVSDDCKAVVGTINLDYRSFYHHFECAAYLYDVSCISDIEQDFQETLGKCSRVTIESVQKMKWNKKLLGILSKWIAPLM